MVERDQAELMERYRRVMREEGHLHPGMIYDPVCDQWLHAGMEMALYRLIRGQMPHVHKGPAEEQE
jgi:hypothetical protein